MREYKVGEEVLVKAYIVCEHATECVVKSERGSQMLVRKDSIIPHSQKTYEDGLNEAWELAIKLIDMTGPEFDEIFQINSWDIHEIMKFSPLEVAEKIKAWEDEKEIHVGDVVKIKISGFKGVASYTDEDECYVILSGGSCGKFRRKDLAKTGRTVDVDSFLAEIGEEG